MLSALQSFSSRVPDIKIQVPKNYFCDEKERVQVMQYFPSTTPLHESLSRLSSFQAGEIGRALGKWLAAFHAWSDEPAQADLIEHLRQNGEAVELKSRLTWGQGSAVLDRHVDVVDEEERSAWDAAKKEARVELERSRAKKRVVHGDFWTGK